jgi:hypothetical protein
MAGSDYMDIVFFLAVSAIGISIAVGFTSGYVYKSYATKPLTQIPHNN